uniref:Uncharacterized protein n=1 Tax=Setaria italica TaxID=4555 RepID=K4A4K0_SETIT
MHPSQISNFKKHECQRLLHRLSLDGRCFLKHVFQWASLSSRFRKAN